MTDDQVIEMAKQARFHSAVLLHIYKGRREALCDSELDELEAIETFAKLVREAVLGEVETLCVEMETHYHDYAATALLNGDVDLSNAASGEPRACRFIAEQIRGMK